MIADEAEERTEVIVIGAEAAIEATVEIGVVTDLDLVPDLTNEEVEIVLTPTDEITGEIAVVTEIAVVEIETETTTEEEMTATTEEIVVAVREKEEMVIVEEVAETKEVRKRMMAKVRPQIIPQTDTIAQ